MKNIFSILLVMVILTMTACVSESNSSHSESKTVTIASIEPTIDEVYSPTTISNFNINPLLKSEIKEMTSEEISNFFNQMVQFTQNANLCSEDMYQIGINFRDIWWYNSSSYDQIEFENKSYDAFCNIYEKAIEQNVPLETLYSWTFIPVPNVLHKYYSSSSFNSTLKISCPAFNYLEEDAAILIAETFFSNPLFASNCNLAYNAINYPSSTVQNMGLSHLIALSKSTDSELVSNYSTYNACIHLFSNASMYEHSNTFLEIAENIMNNPYYDFVEKYIFFCNDDLIEKNISNTAFNYLLELSTNADEETLELITIVANSIYDDALATRLHLALKKNSSLVF